MNIHAIIPIRFQDCCKEDGGPKYILQNKPLWEWTIEHALEEESLEGIVVAYDDPRFERYLEKWGKRIIKFLRPPFLSEKKVNLFQVANYVVHHLDSDWELPEYTMILEITHPLRPKGITRQLINALKDTPVDSIFTVHPIHYNFWKTTQRGNLRIEGSGDNAEVKIFQELIGICSIFRTILLASEQPFGEIVDMIPIHRFWSTIDVRDEDGLWLAEQYLKRIKEFNFKD